MSKINKELLEKARAELLAQRDQLLAQANSTMGKLQLVDQLLAIEAKPDEVPKKEETEKTEAPESSDPEKKSAPIIDIQSETAK